MEVECHGDRKHPRAPTGPKAWRSMRVWMVIQAGFHLILLYRWTNNVTTFRGLFFNYFRSFRLFEALALSFAEIQLISVHLNLNGSINLGDGDQLNFNGGECVLSTVYQCVSKFKSQRNQKDKFATNSSSIRIYKAEWLRLIKKRCKFTAYEKATGQPCMELFEKYL